MSGIGIDLGNSYTRVAICDGKGNVEFLEFENGSKDFPTYLYITEENEFVIGEQAKNKAKEFPQNTIYGVKRFFTTDYKTCVENGQPYPFLLVNNNKLAAVECPVKGEKKVITSQELVKQVYQLIASNPSVKDQKCVVTIPSYYTPQQRESVKQAARDAGLNLRDVVHEQEAAIAAFGEKLSSGRHTVLVFDFSQSNTIVSVYKGNNNNYRQLSIAADDVGGDDVNAACAQFLALEFRSTYKQNLTRNESGMKKLRDAIDAVKGKLVTQDEIEIDVPGIIEGVDYKDKISRDKFDYMADDVYGRATDQITVAIQKAKLKTTDITDVILCGGSARIGKLSGIIEDMCHVKPLTGIDPAEVIAYGAAKLASKL